MTVDLLCTATVWVPSVDDLQQRLCVIAHSGASGHRGAATTAKAIGSLFLWETVGDDVKVFVQGCLHCMTTVGGKVPRPNGETLVATRPNEVFYFDFCTMMEGTGGMASVLVLKDGMSGYVELIACPRATSEEAYKDLLDWFKRFGVVHQWVSDQGTHFKNELIDMLQTALGAHHHFVTAYSPWANGTVEVVNREFVKALKALASERRVRLVDWPSLLPLIQAALNGMPADRLGGLAPVTGFAGLPAEPQLRAILHPEALMDTTLDLAEEEMRNYVAETRVALDRMHREMVDESEKRKRAARARHAKKQGVVLHKFEKGDFVLAATATGRVGNKLALVWRGPKRVVRPLSNYTFEVQDLVELFALTIRHASRLQLYRDRLRGQAEELTEQAIYGEGGHLVEALKACKLSPATQRWEILVKWFGVDEIEASWEPADAIKEDVPALFQAFVSAEPNDKDRQAMTNALMPQPPREPVVRRRKGKRAWKPRRGTGQVAA